MRSVNMPRNIQKVSVVMTGILIGAICATGQEMPVSPAANGGATQAADIRALADSVLALKEQMKLMSAQMEALQKEQERSHEEARELRRKLENAEKNLSASVSAGVGVGYAAPSQSAATVPATPASPTQMGVSVTPQSSEDRAAALEENQQLQDSKINDIYQTKIESGSKYRLRLTGIVLLNLFANRGSLDNQDVPQLAESEYTPYSNAGVGGTLRQSEFGLEAFGPDIAGAHTSADIKFDFAGGFPETPYGTSTGLMRLRTGTIRMDWANTSLVAGQDGLFFAPLAPTSLASLATPSLSYNGNLWNWTPQVRVEHTMKVSESSSVIVEGGILDSLSGEEPLSSYERNATYGESSGQPAYAARVALRQDVFGQNWTLGFGGYYGRQNWGLARKIDGWAGTTDLTAPLGKYFELSGEFYRGRAVAGIGGGVGQSVVLTGLLSDPTTLVKGLDSMGGWAQLKLKLNPRLEFNAAAGQDNPFASELRAVPNTGVYDVPIARNRSALANVIYRMRSDVLLSAEYQRLRTVEIGGDTYGANHITFSLGYLF
jgi:hypothetical protein